MEKLEKALKLRKAKYLKRTGGPGKYKYIYKIAGSKKKEAQTTVDNVKFFEEHGIPVSKIKKEKRVKPPTDDSKLKAYMKEHKGEKAYGSSAKWWKIGEVVEITPEKDVSLPTYKAKIVHGSPTTDDVMVYNSKTKSFETVDMDYVNMDVDPRDESDKPGKSPV